jgi:hypothetical protein
MKKHVIKLDDRQYHDLVAAITEKQKKIESSGGDMKQINSLLFEVLKKSIDRRAFR